LKKQLTSAFDHRYLEKIYNNYTRYNNSSIQVILAYLYDKYGSLYEGDIEQLDS